MTTLAVDIGGANLKVADGCGFARSQAYPLWQLPDELADTLRELFAESPAHELLAVTMTGELADCYRTKAEGVRSILAAVDEVASEKSVRVFLCDGRMVPVEHAQEFPMLAAASNWLALASFCRRFVSTETGLLIDIGSTTTDIVPLVAVDSGSESSRRQPVVRGAFDRRLLPAATNADVEAPGDVERLISGELVYTGVARSPVCAIVDEMPWRDGMCPVAQEVFATSLDAYLVLGLLPEDPADTNTADRGPATRDTARDRLARSICADRTLFTVEDARHAATAIRDAQFMQLTGALQKVVSQMQVRPGTVVVSGAGEFLAQELAGAVIPDADVKSLAEVLGPTLSQCAPAHALAVLAREQPW